MTATAPTISYPSKSAPEGNNQIIVMNTNPVITWTTGSNLTWTTGATINWLGSLSITADISGNPSSAASKTPTIAYTGTVEP